MKFERTSNGVSFACPGCGDRHYIPVEGDSAKWVWNGSLDMPTLTPSIDVKSGHYGSTWKQGDSCWCTYNAAHPERPSSFTCYRCHSIITDGKISFCTDSTHALAGQVVDLPEIPAR
jgi:hypothetical protein